MTPKVSGGAYEPERPQALPAKAASADLRTLVDQLVKLGLEFAVAFEMSPPNWEVYVNPVAAEAAKASAATRTIPVSGPAPETGHAMKGVLSAASANHLGAAIKPANAPITLRRSRACILALRSTAAR